MSEQEDTPEGELEAPEIDAIIVVVENARWAEIEEEHDAGAYRLTRAMNVEGFGAVLQVEVGLLFSSDMPDAPTSRQPTAVAITNLEATHVVQKLTKDTLSPIGYELIAWELMPDENDGGAIEFTQE